jgi:hypothetical protein
MEKTTRELEAELRQINEEIGRIRLKRMVDDAKKQLERMRRGGPEFDPSQSW